MADSQENLLGGETTSARLPYLAGHANGLFLFRLEPSHGHLYFGCKYLDGILDPLRRRPNTPLHGNVPKVFYYLHYRAHSSLPRTPALCTSRPAPTPTRCPTARTGKGLRRYAFTSPWRCLASTPANYQCGHRLWGEVEKIELVALRKWKRGQIETFNQSVKSETTALRSLVRSSLRIRAHPLTIAVHWMLQTHSCYPTVTLHR